MVERSETLGEHPHVSSRTERSYSLIQREFLPPIHIPCQRLLSRLVQHTVFHDQHIHFRSHKTAIGILGRTDDGFASHVERCVNNDPAAGFRFKRLNNR